MHRLYCQHKTFIGPSVFERRRVLFPGRALPAAGLNAARDPLQRHRAQGRPGHRGGGGRLSDRHRHPQERCALLPISPTICFLHHVYALRTRKKGVLSCPIRCLEHLKENWERNERAQERCAAVYARAFHHVSVL
eukprot:3787919-Rhodomonas_salina.1